MNPAHTNSFNDNSGKPLIAFDQSVYSSGATHAGALRNTLRLAQHCEQLGYRRFWVSEHHNNPAIVGSAPEILLGALTALTSQIRIGAAGVLLPFYAPFKVAEQFNVLEALAPGRIDLGLGRSPGGDGNAFRALNPGGSGDRLKFDSKIRELCAWLLKQTPPGAADGDPDTDSLAGLNTLPHNPGVAQPWVLVTSIEGARSAGRLGLAMCFNYSAEQSVGILEPAFDAYRRAFRPGPFLSAPYSALMFFALAADTDEHARYLFSSRGLWRTRLDQGLREPLASPEIAAAYPYSAEQRSRIEGQLERNLVGKPQDLMQRIHRLVAQAGADEIGMNCWTFSLQDRLRSFELLAAAHRNTNSRTAAEAVSGVHR
jgi:luciferase family oxidoreductase group 1